MSGGRSSAFWAGVGATVLVAWFIAYNFFGFRIQGIATGNFFPEAVTPSSSSMGSVEPQPSLDGGQIDGTRRDAIKALASVCQSAGGSQSGCECAATFIVDNTTRDEMVFADEPPSAGTWIYFGGNMWVPGKYGSALQACGP
jgi:hypothetical protein